MKSLIGLLPATAGRIRYGGEDITKLEPERRAHRGIGYIPQGRDVFPRMTIAENLQVGELINRSEEHTSELQSLMRISYAVFCLKKKQHTHNTKPPKNRQL